jgi:hypothetical protein
MWGRGDLFLRPLSPCVECERKTTSNLGGLIMKQSEMLRRQADMLESELRLIATAEELRRRADILDKLEADYKSGWEKE